MGLTRRSVGKNARDHTGWAADGSAVLWAMAGNPNVGKSSLFNTLTGLHQHTGNWTGKTVGCAVGTLRHTGKDGKGKAARRVSSSDAPILLADLPGCYSLIAQSAEEEAALSFLRKQRMYGVIVVCDAGSLSRNLLLAFQIADLIPKERIILCVNLIDELESTGYSINADALQAESGFHVVTTSAKSGRGTDELTDIVKKLSCEVGSPLSANNADVRGTGEFARRAAACQQAALVRITGEAAHHTRKHTLWKQRLDDLVLGRMTAVPVALLFLSLILWLTVRGANVPSRYLALLLDQLEQLLKGFRFWDRLPAWIPGILIDGVYHTASVVTSVMLPPMAIFFPLFTLLEDFGFLPRIAFNFDRCFHACHACGKQALTMCMGLGCNAAGVTGCRIIDSPRERMIAVLTNSLMPCNGQFPTILLTCSVCLLYMKGNGTTRLSWTDSLFCSLMVVGVLVLCVLITLVLSWLLSKSVLKGEASAFILELPPYRKPVIRQVLVRSLLDRTIYVLGRAVAVAAPMGAVLWLLTNVRTGSEQPLLMAAAERLTPVGAWLCVDGAVLLALILSLPANELTVPILLTMYQSAAAAAVPDAGTFSAVLDAAGWNTFNCFAFLFLFVFHIPCSTTLITIYKETGRLRYAASAALLPLSVGLLMCLIIRAISLI